MSKWNWQKINVPDIKQPNLPDFKRTVLLADKRKDKTYVVVGNLESVDINGPHWSTGKDIFTEIFGAMFTTPTRETRDMKYPEFFKPTHWCEIELPEYEEPENNERN